MRRADRRRALARGEPRQPRPDVHLPAVLPAVHRPRTADLRYRAVPERYLSFDEFALDARAWDELQIPVGLAFLFRNSVQERTIAFYPSPAGATESELPLDAWERIVEANPELGHAAARRRGAAGAPANGRGRPAPAISSRSTPATSSSAAAPAVARVRRRRRRRTRRSTNSSPTSSAQPRRAARRSCRHERATTFAVLDVFAEPYAAAPQLTARLRIEEATGQTIHAIALRCQVRIEPQRRRYDDGRSRTALRGLFGERERWVDTLRPFLWMQCNTSVQGFTGVDRGRPRAAVHLRLRRRRLALPARAAATATVPIVLLFSGTVFTRGANGFGVRAGALGLRGALRAAGRGVAADDGRPTSRTPAGSGSSTTSRPRSPTTARRTG